VLVVHGELDLATAPSLCARITRLRDRGHAPDMLIDLSGLEFCDSPGLRALLGERRETEICGGTVEFVVPAHGIVRRLFDVCGVTQSLSAPRAA
jgi:anti-sigma B factor antagonist